jgi:sugar phosphate isomerase/epimerase
MKQAAKVGVGSWAYTCEPGVDPDQLLKALGEIGFEGIELSGSADYHPFDKFPGIDQRKLLVEKLRGFGLSICGYNARLEEFPPTSQDDSVRGKYVGLFETNLQFCADCAIPAIRVDTIDRPPFSLPDRNEAKKRIVEVWRRCAEKASGYGIHIVWEFEPGFIFNKPHDIVEIIRGVDHPNFGALFDTCHAYMCCVIGAKQEEPYDRLKGGVIELVELLKGKILRMHLSDSDGSLHDNLTSTHVPLERGDLDFEAIVKAVLDSGYDQTWWTVDPCFWPQCHQTLLQDREFTENLLKKFGLR